MIQITFAPNDLFGHTFVNNDAILVFQQVSLNESAMPHPAKKPIRIRLPLLLTMGFTAVLFCVGGYIGLEHYQRSKQLILAQTYGLVDAFSDEFVLALENTYRPINTILEIISFFAGTAAEASSEARMAQLPLLITALNSEPHIRAIMTAQQDGRFFIVRNIRSSAALLSYNAPDTTQFVADDISRGADGRRLTRRLFLDAGQQILRDTTLSETTFDPRSRPWYRQALENTGLQITPPYLFFQTNEPGVTLARQADAWGRVLAADITLSELSAALRRKIITPGTKLALVNAKGQVLAYSDATYPTMQTTVQEASAPLLGDARDSPFEVIADRVMDESSGSSEFIYQGNIWLAMTRVLNPSREDSARIVIAVPQHELMAEAETVLLRSLQYTALALLLSIPLVWLVAHSIARPIARLVSDAVKIRHFDFSHSSRKSTSLAEIQRLGEAMDSTTDTISRFLKLISSLASETNFDRLLQTVNRETIEACQADAGILFLLDNTGRTLDAVDLAYARHGSQEPGAVKPASLQDHGDVLVKSFADRQDRIIDIHQGEAILGERFSPLFTTLAKKTLRLMLLPLANRQGEVSGVLCLVFVPEHLHRNGLEDRAAFARSLSGFAAVTIENQYLIRMQKALLDSFIKLLAGAIDAKSPYTGGHCQRVPVLTSMLVAAACRSRDQRFAGFSLDDKEWEAVNIASWLHDCGKVTTPEYVVDKSTKLETLSDRIHEVRMRFEVLKRDVWIDYYRAQSEGAKENDLAQRRDAQLTELDSDFAFVAECNIGGEFIAEDKLQRLRDIATRTWQRTLDDRLGISWEEAQRKARSKPQQLPVDEPLLADKAEHLIDRKAAEQHPHRELGDFNLIPPRNKLNRGELYNLSVRKGTLTEEERFIINDHIVQTILMLEQLPFPRHLRHVPALAGGHHEKMDGTGYPLGLTREEMPLVARVMAIADIFEALTASDRPYKTPKTLSESLQIMSRMSKEQHIDADLFELFITSGVYLEYAIKYLQAEQIDPVDVRLVIGVPA
jgi:HD-GYP domain-containing protein (c-di-GMP phosphodiesterase class II)